MGTKVCDEHHLRRLPPGLPRGTAAACRSAARSAFSQDQAYSNLWGGYTFTVEEISNYCSALLVCSRAGRDVHHRQGIPYRADGEGRLHAVVEVKVKERDLLHNHWA